LLKVPSSGLIAFLEKLEARAPLSVADRAALLELPHKNKLLRRHEFIVREDDMPRECCVLISGFAMRHKTAGNGGRQIFSIHMRGDAIDLHNSLLGRADHNLEMLSAGEAVFIPLEAIREITLARPALGHAMWLETLVDAAIFREWTLNVGRRDARSRMSHMLCEFAVRLEAVGLAESTGYELPMTQEELADTLALTPIHVSRTLKTLVAEGFVSRTNRSVKIIDWHGLAKLGDFDVGYLHLPRKT
jgi:CRP-like cAMP-binding protein